MPRPTSIRTAIWLLYIRLFLSVTAIAVNIRLLVSPTAEENAKYKIDQLTGGQIAVAFVNLLLPVAAVVLTLWFIRRRKRMPAIIASLVVLWFSASLLPQVEMVLGVVTLFLLFGRASKTYFSDSLLNEPKTVQAEEKTANGETVDVADADASSDAEGQAEPVPASAQRSRVDPVVEIRQATPDDAEVVHALMIEAFEEYRAAVPPSSALDETAESVREALQGGEGAAILYEDENPAAMVRYNIEGETINFFRLSVLPSRRRRGYAKRLVKWVEQFGISKGLNVCRCMVRQTVQNNVAMYQNMDYAIVDQQLVVRESGSVKALVMEKKLGV
ncbi:GNAT family N-acetyltransferase [Cohnella sp. CFH 77786]|uniref:GNAT family N-acetyltransferase n=1 Tax=Cohnella sp. CFH 77786 TaxID=2662265 RepID=UPI001C610361|nr:GNAT family N-acetyltransferase [Cohnella sp. CFH 77786]MBW5447037.1 GNAT family N-acetyltransferase [Cohnella sp. CFH 77786]